MRIAAPHGQGWLFLYEIVHTLGALVGDIVTLDVYCFRMVCHELGTVPFCVLIEDVSFVLLLVYLSLTSTHP